MSGLSWAKFYWSDWESDPALRLCSYAAQGLWMRMLCIAAAHDPIGYVCVAGRALDETSIARMTGGTESEVCSLIVELDRNGVCSRDRTGRIYSRRMVRDARKSAEARKNGKLGGNPKLGKDTSFSAEVNPQDKGWDKPQKLEARIPESTPIEPNGSTSPMAEVRPKAKARGSRFAPDEWSPSEADMAFAGGLGFTAGEIERELAKFRRHEFPRPYTHWSKTFQNWLDRASERSPRHERPNPDAKLLAKQANYERAWTGSERAAGRDWEP